MEPGSIADAALELTAFQDMNNHTLRLYGLENSIAGQDWDESTAAFDTAFGLEFDGESASRGREDDELLLLGQFNTGSVAEGDILSFTNPDLAVFLNLLQYQTEGSANLATLLIERQNNSNGQSLFATKEATQLATGFSAEAGTYAPRLVLDAIFADVALLPGDFNDDGVVNSADYVVWRNGLASGDFTQEDYDTWRTHYGSTLADNEGGGAGSTIPEPTSRLLSLLAASGVGFARRKLVGHPT
jgi:hypothetical protein